MRHFLFLFLGVFLSCNQNSKQIENMNKAEESEVFYMDSVENHFDCTIYETYQDSSGYYIVTECGMFIQVDSVYQIGDTLKGFYSLKHK